MEREKITEINFKGNKVLLSKQVARYYEATDTMIKQNFNNNKTKFTEGKHYFIATGVDLKEIKLILQNNEVEIFDLVKKQGKLYLWTEKGCMLLAKSLGTDRAWEEYEFLVDYYFAVEEKLETTGAVISNVDTVMNTYFRGIPEDLKPMIKGFLTQAEQDATEINQYRTERKRFTDAEGGTSFRDFVKELKDDFEGVDEKLNEVSMSKWIIENLKIMFRQSKTDDSKKGKMKPYTKYVDLGWFKPINWVRNGITGISYGFTYEGKVQVSELLLEKGYIKEK